MGVGGLAARGLKERVVPREYELYDLQTDPNEDHNLYGKPRSEELTAHLRARLRD